MNEDKKEKTHNKSSDGKAQKDSDQKPSGTKGGQAKQDLGDIYEEDIIEIEGPADIPGDENDL